MNVLTENDENEETQAVAPLQAHHCYCTCAELKQPAGFSAVIIQSRGVLKGHLSHYHRQRVVCKFTGTQILSSIMENAE